ncbi:MAG TPA: hypothetical protein VFX41_07775 [Actinomycetales bacterium]|nr:hypothetical protein [Actinomycetales bacterium]
MTAKPAGPVVGRDPFASVRPVADAVLYEGYLLYPYRRSSGKNQVRWQFGVLAPRTWIEANGRATDGVAGSEESWWQQTECLVEARTNAVLRIQFRFLQLQAKDVEELRYDGSYVGVGRLDLGDRSEVTFEEATPHSLDAVVRVGEQTAAERVVQIVADGVELVDDLPDALDVVRGRVRRTRWPVAGQVMVSLHEVPAPFPLLRVRLRVENTTRAVTADMPREVALRYSMMATHTLLAVEHGRFVSLLDPPVWAQAAAKECRNVRTFPVLAGDPEARDMVLSSPIILYDYPQVAPESPGDLHDAAEIDEILSLRTLTLTDDEKREARATDARAREIVDRVDAMPPEVMERLHGAVRSLRPARAPGDRTEGQRPDLPWWDPGADASVSPETDCVDVGGVPVGRGCRVRLKPRRRGTDAHDMFLAGRTARVEAVFLDIDDTRHLAVTIEDDPTAELHQWYGRYHYFRPDEVEPLHGDGAET